MILIFSGKRGDIMAVYKDSANGKWYYVFSYTTATGEKKRHKKRGFELKKDALDAEAAAKVKLKNAPPCLLTLKQLYEMYVAAKRPEWLPGSERKFTDHMRLHILPYLGDLAIDKITTQKIEDWKLALYSKTTPSGKKYTARTLNNFRGDFSALFNYAIKHQMISFNPIHAVTPFKDPSVADEGVTEKQIWTPQEFQKFISVVDNEMWKLFFTFLWCTGTRIGEAQAVMFKDVEDNSVKISKSVYTKQKGVAYIINPTKTKKMRQIELPPEFIEMLVPYVEKIKKEPDFKPDWFLFGCDKPLANTTIDKTREKYIKLAGVKRISSHCFRHSHASYLLANGIDIKSVSERLGHKDVKETLNTYVHVLPVNKDKIIRLLSSSLQNET